MRIALLFSLALFVGRATSLAKVPALTHQELFSPPPNIIRTCCAFGVDLSVARIPFVKKSDLLSLDQLGTHQYLGGKLEGNGIIYTKRGGFIDLGHLRDYADWTAYLYARMEYAREHGSLVALDLGSEGGHKSLLIDLDASSQKPNLPQLAGKIAFDLSLWHEIATWFGASYIPFVPERYSSFSPEDLYSNLLGTKIGIEAIESELPFEQAVTQILMQYLLELEVVSSLEETQCALEQVEDIWWTNKKALPSAKVLLMRNVNADRVLQPWLVAGISHESEASSLELPSEDLNEYYSLTVKTNTKIGLKKIFPDSYSEFIDQHDFIMLLDYIDHHQLSAEVAHKKRARSRPTSL